ncbi:MAG: RNA-binding S4 domain-containing protein [Bacteroidia bacterium]
METKAIRADTYLWAIRMFKSRTLAHEAISGGKVKLNDASVKASHTVKVGEVYTISIGTQRKIVEVLELLEKRPSFEIAKKYYKDLSPPAEKKDKAEQAFFTFNVSHEKGTGRPTKKNRRDLGKSGGWFD